MLIKMDSATATQGRRCHDHQKNKSMVIEFPPNLNTNGNHNDTPELNGTRITDGHECPAGGEAGGFGEEQGVFQDKKFVRSERLKNDDTVNVKPEENVDNHPNKPIEDQNHDCQISNDLDDLQNRTDYIADDCDQLRYEHDNKEQSDSDDDDDEGSYLEELVITEDLDSILNIVGALDETSSTDDEDNIDYGDGYEAEGSDADIPQLYDDDEEDEDEADDGNVETDDDDDDDEDDDDDDGEDDDDEVSACFSLFLNLTSIIPKCIGLPK